MAMWNPDDFKKVLTKADESADGSRVNGAWDVEVVEELPPTPGGGESQPKWLKVRAYSPDGETILEGFMLREWLKPVPLEIDRDIFARACLGAAQTVGTNAEYLLAFADLVSKVTNPPAKASTACGPFQFTEDMWKSALAADQDLDLEPFDRFKPYLQPLVAASITSHAEKAQPNIGADELSLILLFGQAQAGSLITQPQGTAFDVALRAAFQGQPQGAALADLKFKEDPAQLFTDPASKKTRSIAEVRVQLIDKLDPVFKNAAETIGPNTQDDSDTGPSDVPMGDQLSLGPNEVYRDALLFAAKRTNFAAAALAALIDAEALKRKRLWDPLSDARPHSSAFGLTQFLNDTWLAEAKKTGTFLNEKGNELKFVNGTTIVNQAALLALRKDPRQSITAAAEYAVANLAQLERQGVTSKSLADKGFRLTPKADGENANKAKLAYLAHHEGVSGAMAIVGDALGETSAERLLRANAGKERAPQLRAKAGSWKEAYVDWLFEYIRTHIVPSQFLAKAPAGAASDNVKPSASGGAVPDVPKKPSVIAPKPGRAVADADGAFQLTQAHLIGLWKRSAFPIDTGRLTVFGLRGCLPVDQTGTGLANEHAIKFDPINYTTMKCTIGQWQPGTGFALFPGSTVPFGATVRKLIAAGGEGVNQLSPGRYPRYEAGFHQRKEGRAGHWALLQGCALAVQRTADDADFDLADRWQVDDRMGDNIHCAFSMGPKSEFSNSSFSSAGCQTIAGRVKKGVPGTAEGPFAKFIAPFQPGKQATTEYVMFPGAEVEQMIKDQFRGERIVLRIGSQGDAVKALQRSLGLHDDGDFGATTFSALIKFQTDRLGKDADSGIVDARTAAALQLELPFFNFNDAIAGGSGQSKTPPA